MTTTVEQIDAWLGAASEHEQLEFKEAKQQYSNDKLYKYCIAISNEGGGHFVLGVTNKKPRRVVGTRAFNNPTDMASKLFREVGFRVDIEEVEHPDGRVLIFHIPPRPRGSARSYQGTYWMRVGEELQPMSEDQLRRIFEEGKPDWLEQPALKGVSAQDVVELLDTQTFFELLQLPYPSNREAVLDRLEKRHVVCSEAGGFTISRLGALLLAKYLGEFDDLDLWAPRVIVYSGLDKLQTTSDITGGKGYAVGFRGLVDYVMGQLPQNEIISKALREEHKLLPEVVIRELLANALVHQDFSVTGMRPMVEVYANRVEISNPGEPVIPVERLIDGSQSRNEHLADLMRRFRICEERSSGIDRIIDAAETHQLPPPYFVASLQRTQVVVFGPKPFQEMDRGERLRACYQHCVLQHVLHR